MPLPHRRPKPDRRRALELLAGCSADGEGSEMRFWEFPFGVEVEGPDSAMRELAELATLAAGRIGEWNLRARRCIFASTSKRTQQNSFGLQVSRFHSRSETLASSLILKRASASRSSGQWSDDDYDVLEDGVIVGRTALAASPACRSVVAARIRHEA
jgi:hypothetical protein